MKKVCFILSLFALLWGLNGFAFAEGYEFSEAKHKEWLSTQKNYALADSLLNRVWKELKNTLSAQDYNALLADQQTWLNSGRVESANEYAPEFPESEAFTQATFDRVVRLDSLMPPKSETLKYTYEGVGSAELVLGGDSIQLNVQTTTSEGKNCTFSLYGNYPLYQGWNYFYANEEEKGLVALFLLNNLIVVSETYMTGNNPASMPSSFYCPQGGTFEGIYYPSGK